MRYSRLLTCLVLLLLGAAALGESDGSSSSHETLRAFEPKDPEVVRMVVRSVYAVMGVAFVGLLAFFVGWARYYSPRYWQQNDGPPKLVQSRARSAGEERGLETAKTEPNKFDLENDLIDFIRDVDRRIDECHADE